MYHRTKVTLYTPKYTEYYSVLLVLFTYILFKTKYSLIISLSTCLIVVYFSTCSTMVLSFEDQLASSCPNFVRTLRIRHSRIITDAGADYYLINTNYKLVKLAYCLVHSCHNFKYVADATFVKKYSSLFDLGHTFEWNTYEDLKAWMNMIVAQGQKLLTHIIALRLHLPFLR